MKKSQIALALLISANMAFAQGLEVKTNPVGFAFGVTNLGLEYAFAKDPTFSVCLAGWHISDNLKEWNEIEWNAGASLGFRKYVLSKSDDHGLYMGIAARYIDSDLSEYNSTYDQNGEPVRDVNGDRVLTYRTEPKSYSSAGFTLGYKQVFSDKFTIDALIGIGRILWREDDSNVPAEFIGGFNFGYRF